MSIEEVVQDLAAIAALKKIIADSEADLKDELAEEMKRGTVYAYDDNNEPLGYASIPKPSQPKPSVTIFDESRVLPWAIEMFGTDVMTQRLTEPGRTSVEAYARAEHKAAGVPTTFSAVEGVTVVVPPPRISVPRFTPDKNVVGRIEGMLRRGKLSISDILTIEGIK